MTASEHEHLWVAISEESDLQLEWHCGVCGAGFITEGTIAVVGDEELLVFQTPPGYVVRGRRPAPPRPDALPGRKGIAA